MSPETPHDSEMKRVKRRQQRRLRSEVEGKLGSKVKYFKEVGGINDIRCH